ncbi:CPBP family intramembrane glutamic endopeptidase [Algibacillus agarilyticus]|uniref:CPBP family intramembrane glutamic endopeptidase n=1 Tax=Algibacillus agarilyticus TaxID=2234133 RepID=UPI000DCFDE25|nr:type II CAAX endopeptidase family protein [Algibacillus agarilyticus]
MELYCWNKMGARNIRTATLAILLFLMFLVLSESILIKYIQVLGYRAYITQKISYIVFFFIALGFAWLIKNVANIEPIKINKISNTSICLLVVTGITATILDIGILGSHVYIASFISYEYAVSLYDFKESTLTIAPNEKLGNSFDSIVLFIICQVILAPLIEEIYFRGIIFKQLYQRGGFIFSAIISSLVFCALHPQNLWLAVFISGLVYCYIYIKTNNLLY